MGLKRGPIFAQVAQRERVPGVLVGSSNETEVIVNGLPVLALLDTGSTVSTIGQTFYANNFAHLSIRPLNDLLDIECADGQSLPYSGYIELEMSPKCISKCQPQVCLFLVVPDSRYNSRVPLLLGTNVLIHFMDQCKQHYGTKFLQDAELHTSWYLAFRCLALRDKELSKQNFRLGLVRSSESQNILVPPNGEVVVNGFLDRKLPYQHTCALMQATKVGRGPSNLDIAPTLIHYNYDKNMPVEVNISNLTTRPIVISPRTVLCEVQPVDVLGSIRDTKPACDLEVSADRPGSVSDILPPPTGTPPSVRMTEPSQPIDDASNDTFNVLEHVYISSTGLTEVQKRGMEDLIWRYRDVFSSSDTDIGHSTAVEHRVDLTDDAPFKQRHRRIPPSMYSEVRNHLNTLLHCDIIRPSHSPWASNVVLAKKKDGSMRMCVDFRQLNKRTIKDSYALPRIEEILDALAGSKYFTVLDMKMGYHQVEVLEEHKQRTAFTVGPLGFYEYNRLPFGMVNAPATYQRLMEECLGDLHTTICFIYLDDLIIFSSSYEEHLVRVEKILQRLRECSLKLSSKKCFFLQERVKYVGHIVSERGIEADPEKIQRVVDWPVPKNPDEVRQFLGFAGYYRKYVQGFSMIARPLVNLMPTPEKSKRGRKKTLTGTDSNGSGE